MKRIIDYIFIYIPVTLIAISLIWVLAYRWMPIRWTPLMLKRTIENAANQDYRNRQVWSSKENISPVLIEAILLTEDQRFYSHKGFDFYELRKMKKEHLTNGKDIRGCSTISQQVAKNCFTFGSHTWLRKGIEAYYTALIEILWGKERILEVYLNIAETGRGLFGMEAACQRYFGTSASEISVSDAAALACVLPKPLTRTPEIVMSIHAHRHSAVASELGKRYHSD